MKKRSARTETHLKQLPQSVNKTQSQTLCEAFPVKKLKGSRSLYNQLSSAFNEVISVPPAEARNAVLLKRPVILRKSSSKQVAVSVELLNHYKSQINMADEEAPTGDAPPPEEAPPAEAEAPADDAPPAAATASQPGDGQRKESRGPSGPFGLVDSGVLQELREADAKATKTSKLIESMKKDIIKFSKKKDMTDEDLKKLKGMHEALNEKLSEFEKIANNVQRLLGVADLTPETLAVAMSTTPCPGEPQFQGKGAGGQAPVSRKSFQVEEDIHLTASEEEKMAQMEDKLPKVIICNTGKEEVPKIIVCERVEPVVEEESIARGLAEKLCDSYKMQEKLANEAAEMEGCRYDLQEEIITKDRTLETLQKQVECLQKEMKLIAKENAELQKKLLQSCQPPHPPMCKRDLYMKFTGSLPEWDAGRASNKDIEKVVDQMEGIVSNMKTEIGDVQTERKMLKTQTQMLQCAFAHQPTCQKELALQHQQGVQTSPCLKELEGQLRDMNEKYNRLNCDFNNKIAELACLRTELKNERTEIEHIAERCCYAEARADDLIERLKMVEIEKQNLVVNREQFIDLEQQMCVAKQRLQNAQEENESLHVLVQEQATQIEDYKEKYMGAQQTVEEQKRVVEKLHVQSLEVKESLVAEVQQFKCQIEEKLSELAPLPEKLRLNETKLELAQQNVEELTKELLDAREIIENKLRSADQSELEAEKAMLAEKLCAADAELQELRKDCTNLKATVTRFEELTQQREWQFEEKVSELTQLSTQLATVREESARQIVKTKERCETVRKLMTAQVSMLERQLAESRASANAAAKERDEIQVRMQQQVTNLNDNFGQAQLRIKCLQEHINYLKMTTV